MANNLNLNVVIVNFRIKPLKNKKKNSQNCCVLNRNKNRKSANFNRFNNVFSRLYSTGTPFCMNNCCQRFWFFFIGIKHCANTAYRQQYSVFVIGALFQCLLLTITNSFFIWFFFFLFFFSFKSLCLLF